VEIISGPVAPLTEAHQKGVELSKSKLNFDALLLENDTCQYQVGGR
jgi:hypothetical protein